MRQSPSGCVKKYHQIIVDITINFKILNDMVKGKRKKSKNTRDAWY